MTKFIQANNSWRDAYNPLRGLTLARAVALLEQGQSGDYADLHWCYKFVEETDADVFALLERRLSAIAEMDWTIKIVSDDTAGFDKGLAEAQSAALYSAYEQIDNLTEAIEHLETSAFRGFAFLQAQGNADGFKHLELLDSWSFLRDGMHGDWYWNPGANATTAKALGDAARLQLDRDRLICLETTRHIDRLGLIKFVRANLSEKDWDSFIEIFGIPLPIITGPEDIDPNKADEFRAAAEQVAAGGTGYLPYGSTVNYPDVERGSSPYDTRLEWLSKKLVLAGTGGMLTMLAESGSGTLAGNAHMETFKSIARSRAAKVSEKLQLTIDRFELQRLFAGRPRLAYFDIAAEEEQDIGQVIEHAGKLRTAGYKMDVAQLEEKTGYKLVEAEPLAAQTDPQPAGQHSRTITLHSALEQSFDPQPAGQHSRTITLHSALEQSFDPLLSALHKDLQPLRERIAEALQIEDDTAMQAALRRIADDSPALYRVIADGGALGDALELELAKAVAVGMANTADTEA